MTSFNVFQGLAGFFGLVTTGRGDAAQSESPNPNPIIVSPSSTSRPTQPSDHRSNIGCSSDSSDDETSRIYSHDITFLPNDFGGPENAVAVVEKGGEGRASGLLGDLFEDVFSTSASTSGNDGQATPDDARSTIDVSNADNGRLSIVNDASVASHGVAIATKVESNVPAAEGNATGTDNADIEEPVKAPEMKKGGVQQVNMSTEHSDTNSSSSSDTSSIHTIESVTTVESDEGTLADVAGPKATTVEEVNGSAEGLPVEETACETVETGNAVDKPVATCRSFADELAEWRVEREKERAAWAVKNAILMESINTGTSAWYENKVKAVEIDVDKSDQGFVTSSYQDQLAQLKRELDALKAEENTTSEAADTSAALVDPVHEIKSFAEELAEWRTQQEKEREEWEIENRIRTGSMNVSAFVRVDDKSKPAKIDTDKSVQGASAYTDGLAVVRATERADWGAKHDPFAPLYKLQLSSQTRNKTKYLLFARDDAVISETSTKGEDCQGLVAYGQAKIASFPRPPRMMRGGRKVNGKYF